MVAPHRVQIADKAVKRLRAGHPWVYRNELSGGNREPLEGESVVLQGTGARFLGRGIYDRTGDIAVRRYSRNPDIPFGAALGTRLAAAQQLRQRLFRDPEHTDCYRLVNGAGDGLPGIVVDQYGYGFSVHLYSEGMRSRAEQICAALARLPGAGGVWSREFIEADEPPEELEVVESGLRYRVRPGQGQKTGLFLDQRDNRCRLGSLVQPGDSALDLFCNAGGFGLHAARAGAGRVVLSDVSSGALQDALENLQRNGLTAVQAETLKLDLLKGKTSPLREQGPFDVVVCDPPALARRQQQLGGAHRAYRRLQRLSIDLLSPGGVLATFSCTARVTLPDLLGFVKSAARDAGRELIVLERTEHAADHPVPAGFPEGRYLKGLFCLVR